jgi:tRNA dimethylallyltransferase
LIDICDLREAFDAAQFVQRANQAVEEIQARGRTPVFCGGTGLYFKAFLDGVGEAPPADERLRAELTATPLETLVEELRQRDPATFEKIDRQNPRRVIRAIEVIRLTGRPFSEQRSEWGPGNLERKPATGSRTSACEAPEPPEPNAGPAKIVCPTPGFFCLMRNPDDLRNRINARVDEMFSRGLVEETRRLLPHGLAENQTAMQAIGYRQVVEYLRDERGLEETIELVKTRTRKFAKRQLTWFRRHGNCRWIELGAGETVEETLAKIAA